MGTAHQNPTPKPNRYLLTYPRTSPFQSAGTDYAVASESVAIDALDPEAHFRLSRDVRAGEAIFISTAGEFFSKDFHPDSSFRENCGAASGGGNGGGAVPPLTPCIFEYVYFARPDSVSAIMST